MENYLNMNEKFKEENIVPLEKDRPRKNTLVNYYRWMLYLLFIEEVNIYIFMWMIVLG